jgi:hypothetical protein
MSSPDWKLSPNADNEKKLWLDYLSKLHDREERSDQITGATNWVLYGVLGTLFYKALEFLPAAFASKDYRYNTYIFVILGFNLLVFGAQAIDDLRPKIKVSSEIRALPNRLEILLVDYFAVMAIFTVLLGSTEFYLGYQNPYLTKTVRLSLFIFGIIHLLLGFFCGAFFRIKQNLDRVQPGMLPQFRVESLRGEGWTNIFLLLAASASLVSIITHLQKIRHVSSTWLLSIQSAFGILIFFWAAYKLIVLRPNRAQIGAGITDLERQALMENLSASEIRDRFNKLTHGIGLKDWLQESSESATKVRGDIENYLDSAVLETNNVCSLLPDNKKLEKLRDLKKKIEKETAEYNKPFSVSAIQSGAAVAVNWILSRATLTETIARMKEYKKSTDQLDVRIKDLFKLLDTEINRTLDQINAQAKHVVP